MPIRTSLSGRVGRRIPVSASTFAVHARLTRPSSRFTQGNLPPYPAIDHAFCQERGVRCDRLLMEAATPLPFSQVRVVGDSLRVDGLVVHDETAVRLAAEHDDPSKLVSDAIEIGARVLDREQTGANAEFVKAEFEKAASELNVEFVERARNVAEGMNTVITRHFNDESSEAVQHKVRQIVRDVSTEMQK